MASRSDEPRRDPPGSRRGPSPGQDGGGGGRGTGRGDGGQPPSTLGGISDARAYTPRGRTVRDAPELRRTPRTGRPGDPFRPALQVLDGGRAGAAPTSRRNAATGTGRSGATGTGREATGQSGRPGHPAGRGEPGRSSADQSPASGRSRAAQPGRGDGAARTAGRTAGAARTANGGTASTRSARSRTDGGRRTWRDRRAGEAGRQPRRRPPRKPVRPPRLADSRRRLRLGTVLVLALFVTIGIRLVGLQLVQAPAYANGGVDRRIQVVTLPAPRGTIFDRDGNPLAHSVEARYVYADPELVRDPSAAAAALSPLLGIPRSELMPRLVRQKGADGQPSQFEWLARGVEIETAKKIMALGLPGIGVHRDERREVPGGDLAANLIGFTSVDMTGLEGLEARYDELLRGVNGERRFEAGLGELDSPIPGGYYRHVKPQPGSSLQLTVDRDLQYRVQQVLSGMMRKVDGSIGAAIVLDVRTGEVLAQASEPTYDAGDPTKSRPTDREDAATSFVVDPGSVHKAVVFGAGLQEGIIKADSAFPVPSAVRKGDTVFSDTHDARGRQMSVAGMMAYSSNVGTIRIADALTPQKLYEYQRAFGLGEATGVGVPGEAAGRLLPPAEWSGSSYGSVPIGHSVDATPLQMAAVYAAIANNGTWVQPHLVKETIAPDGTRAAATAPKTREVLSPENAAALRTMLEAVTTVPDATGRKAAIPGYRVAGKTGTGKRIVNGRYAPGEVASFIGMAPADNPRYVVAVFAYTPKGGGGDIAAPAFQQMMSFTLLHYRVPPTGAPAPRFTVYPG